MTNLYDDAAFVVDLMLGHNLSSGFHEDLNKRRYEEVFEDAQRMGRVVDRLRAQTWMITEGVRRWERRHREIDNPLERRYSSYEGLLARHDLRQHWLLYRRATRHFHALHDLCLDKMAKIQPRKPYRRNAAA